MGRYRALTTAVVGVAAILAGLWFMARTTNGDTGRRFTAEFDNVVGLVNNSPVLQQGVKVGEVVDIAVKPGSGGKIAVLTVQLQEDEDISLTSETTLVLRLKSILGEFFLDLDPGSSPDPLDTSKPVTNTHRDTSLDQILYQGAALFEEVRAAEQTKSLAHEVRSLLETSGDDLNAITENTKLIVESLNTRVESVSRIIQNLDVLTASTEGKAGELGVAIDDANRMLANLRRTLADNNERIKGLLETVNELVAAADTALLDEQLAKLPEYIDKLDHGLLIVRAFLQHKIPLLSVMPALKMDLGEDALAQAKALHNSNPFAAKLLADFLEPIFYQ